MFNKSMNFIRRLNRENFIFQAKAFKFGGKLHRDMGCDRNRNRNRDPCLKILMVYLYLFCEYS